MNLIVTRGIAISRKCGRVLAPKAKGLSRKRAGKRPYDGASAADVLRADWTKVTPTAPTPKMTISQPKIRQKLRARVRLLPLKPSNSTPTMTATAPAASI